jgi:hypothetical protein
MFAVLHSDINSLKSGHLQLTYCKKGRLAKVELETKALGTISLINITPTVKGYFDNCVQICFQKALFHLNVF